MTDDEGAAYLPALLPATAEPAAPVIDRLTHLEAALQISRPAETIESASLRRIAASWAAQHRVLDARRDDIVLAVGEATANSVVHAYLQSTGPAGRSVRSPTRTPSFGCAIGAHGFRRPTNAIVAGSG